MMGFLGDPTRLFMKPEKPDFFRNTADLTSRPSSEKRFGLTRPSGPRGPWAFSDRDESIAVKLAEVRSRGEASRGSVPGLTSGGG